MKRDAAVRAGKPRLAVEAIDEIDKWFVIDAFPSKLEVLGKISESPDAAPARAVMKTALDQVDEAITAGNSMAGQQLMDMAEAIGKRPKLEDAPLNLLKRRRQEFTVFQKASQAVVAARETLRKTPADPEANFVVGKHLCMFEGRRTRAYRYWPKARRKRKRRLPSKTLLLR